MILRNDSWNKETGLQGTLFHQGWSLRIVEEKPMTREKGTRVYNRGERHLGIINVKAEDTDLKGCLWSSLIFSKIHY